MRSHILVVTPSSKAGFVAFDLASSATFLTEDNLVPKQVFNMFSMWVNKVVNVFSFNIVQFTADGAHPAVFFSPASAALRVRVLDSSSTRLLLSGSPSLQVTSMACIRSAKLPWARLAAWWCPWALKSAGPRQAVAWICVWSCSIL